MRSRYSIILLLGVLVLLAACGSTNQRPAETSNSKPAPIATMASPAVTESTTSAMTSDHLSTYAGIPQSQTSEGYHVLGDPNAPVVLTHYSDFL